MPGPPVSTRRLVPARGVPGGVAPRREASYVDEVGARLQVRGVGEILDTALDVLFARFAICVGVAVTFLLPFRVAAELAPAERTFDWQLTFGLPELLTTAFVCSVVGAHLFGRSVSAGTALRDGATALPGTIVIAIVQGVASVGLVCLCVVPAILPSWAFAAVPAVYVLERARLVRGTPPGLRWVAGIWGSMVRGMRLVFETGAFLRWVGWSAVGLAGVYLPLTLWPQAFDQPQLRDWLHELLGLEDRWARLGLATIGAVFAAIGTAYLAILKTVYYVDQRVRREALDVELALDELERASARGAEASA